MRPGETVGATSRGRRSRPGGQRSRGWEVPLYQQTIAEKVSCTGIGLHSGAPAQLSRAVLREVYGAEYRTLRLDARDA